MQVAGLAHAAGVSVSEYVHYVLFPPQELVLDEDLATLAGGTGELAYAGAEGPDGTGEVGEPVELPGVAANAGAVAAQPVNAVAAAAVPLPDAAAVPVSPNREFPSSTVASTPEPQATRLRWYTDLISMVLYAVLMTGGLVLNQSQGDMCRHLR